MLKRELISGIKAYEQIDPAFDLYFAAKRGEQQHFRSYAVE